MSVLCMQATGPPLYLTVTMSVALQAIGPLFQRRVQQRIRQQLGIGVGLVKLRVWGRKWGRRGGEETGAALRQDGETQNHSSG